MTTSNPIFHQAEGLVVAPMAKARFKGWVGYFFDALSGETLRFWSPYRVSTGWAISATKTLNDSVYLLDERITQWMNGAKEENLDDEGFVQGSLSL